jgi:predicted nucleic acid-binding protein
MIRAFVDASVLMAACLSSSGASREIILHAIRGNVSLVISELVIKETARNLATKAPKALPAFDQFLNAVSFEFVRPSKQQVLEAAAYIALKDAPIVAAAKHAQIDFLVSLDRRHLVGLPDIARKSGLNIVLPGELLEEIRNQVGDD